ncbi:MAG: SGNH/GDSL hydrolase family protein [Verrucomicrobiae bacterium]|nr:SGNH/GDSL hydrolase family protein [Verrucomicrobiae bacterium]NNJ86029.1 SGNH/GDSL hydrolase family protein [Akkermansiaceae bacterium]
MSRGKYELEKAMCSGNLVLSRLVWVSLWLSIAAPLHAQTISSPEEFKSPVAAKPFEAGDRVAFLGDSITASGRYVHMLRLFYATRFPDRPLHLYNCGIGGARAPSSLSRLDEDCLALDPNRVVVMLGMNDANGGKKNYQSAMTPIMDRIVEKPDCRPTLIISSPYDNTAKIKARNKDGKNDKIRSFGQWLVDMGRQREVAVVDFNTPLLRVNEQRQKNDPAFSAIGPDRVHPGDHGHAVMTWSFLRAQGITGPVARLVVDATTNSVTAENSKAGELKIAADQVSFLYTPKALPYPAEALPFDSPAEEWVPFTKDLNREWLLVQGLRKGRWSLSIDGEAVGQFSAKQLAAGIDLARESKSPSYRHSKEILALANRIHESEQNLRAIARVRWLLLEPLGIDLDDTARADAVVRDYVGKRPNHGYWQNRAEVFFRFRAPEKRKAEHALMERLMTRLYEINQPKPQQMKLHFAGEKLPN